MAVDSRTPREKQLQTFIMILFTRVKTIKKPVEDQLVHKKELYHCMSELTVKAQTLTEIIEGKK